METYFPSPFAVAYSKWKMIDRCNPSNAIEFVLPLFSSHIQFDQQMVSKSICVCDRDWRYSSLGVRIAPRRWCLFQWLDSDRNSDSLGWFLYYLKIWSKGGCLHHCVVSPSTKIDLIVERKVAREEIWHRSRLRSAHGCVFDFESSGQWMNDVSSVQTISIAMVSGFDSLVLRTNRNSTEWFYSPLLVRMSQYVAWSLAAYCELWRHPSLVTLSTVGW